MLWLKPEAVRRLTKRHTTNQEQTRSGSQLTFLPGKQLSVQGRKLDILNSTYQ